MKKKDKSSNRISVRFARKYILYDEEWGDKKVLDKIEKVEKLEAIKIENKKEENILKNKGRKIFKKRKFRKKFHKKKTK